MIEEQKEFKDIFKVNDFYVLNPYLDKELLNLGFKYSVGEFHGARELSNFCVVGEYDCRIVFVRDLDREPYMYVIPFFTNYFTLIYIGNVLQKTTNELEIEIINKIKGE